MPTVSGIYFYACTPDEDAPPVVLIHGAAGNHLSWPPEIRRLPGCRVYALDLPGHGKSNGHVEQSIDRYAQQVYAWLLEMDLHRVTLVGHSMGGAIAKTLAHQHPHRITKLVLIGTGVRLPVSPQIMENIANPVTMQNALDAILKWSFYPETSPALVKLAGQRLAEVRQSVFQGDFIACQGFNGMDWIEAIAQPTLVLCGEQDKMTPLRYSQYLAGKIPRATLEVIPEAGHMVMLEQPERVAGALLAFVERQEFWFPPPAS